MKQNSSASKNDVNDQIERQLPAENEAAGSAKKEG
jgi:hypothetical protein